MLLLLNKGYIMALDVIKDLKLLLFSRNSKAKKMKLSIFYVNIKLMTSEKNIR